MNDNTAKRPETQPCTFLRDAPTILQYPPRVVKIRPAAPLALGLWLIFGLSLSGCYSGYHLTRSAPDSVMIHERGQPRQPVGFPVYLPAVIARPPDEDSHTQYELARKLGATGLYPGVFVVSPPGRAIAARLEVETSPQEAQEDWNLAKMVLTGLTAFLLTPALPLTLDDDSVYSLQVDWPSGQTTRYTAACGTHAYATLDKYRNAQQSAKALKESSCLNSLVNQMSKDHPGRVGNAVYTPPSGTTTSQMEKSSPSAIQDDPSPEDVCQVLGYRPGSKPYADCLIGVH